jgi:hypothetical protein
MGTLANGLRAAGRKKRDTWQKNKKKLANKKNTRTEFWPLNQAEFWTEPNSRTKNMTTLETLSQHAQDRVGVALGIARAFDREHAAIVVLQAATPHEVRASVMLVMQEYVHRLAYFEAQVARMSYSERAALREELEA